MLNLFKKPTCKECGKKLSGKQKRFCSVQCNRDYYSLTLCRTNFYIASKGDFYRVDTPTRKPDYVSYFEGRVSSEYWFTKVSVIRRSNHWGNVASCVWHLKNAHGLGYPDQLQWQATGECLWKDLSWRDVKHPELMVEVLNRFKDVPEAMEQIKKQLR